MELCAFCKVAKSNDGEIVMDVFKCPDLRDVCLNCCECPDHGNAYIPESDYYSEVIQTLRDLMEGIQYLTEDSEGEEDPRINHLHDAIIWIRMHVLDPDHPLSIN